MNIKCSICTNKIDNKVTNWTYYCDQCDYWSSELIPSIANTIDPIFNKSRDDDNVISFLDPVRIENFNKILDYIELNIGINKSILDVGCASGLFMEMAILRGNNVYGVEPNPVMYSAARRKNLNVINGYFPDDIDAKKKYDVIIFNDVFEHIPDINKVMISCLNFITEDGVLIINIPNSNGIIFKIAKFLAKNKIYGPWNRLWQTMFYTPHLHYFNPNSLSMLARKNNFNVVLRECQLDSFYMQGLWERISFDNSNNFFKKILIYIVVGCAYPFLKLMPKDSFFSVYRIIKN